MTLAFEIEDATGVNANVFKNSLTLRHLLEGIQNATILKIDFCLPQRPVQVYLYL